MADSIKIGLEIDSASVQKALNDLSSQSNLVEKGFQKIQSSGNNTFNGLAVQIGKAAGVYDIFVGNIAANLATKAFESIKESAAEFFHTMIEEAAKSEQAIRNLNVALRQAGLYSDETSKNFQEYAAAIQKTTIYSDDAVLSSVALFAALTNLDENGIKQATTAATNLATTLNVPLAEATDMIVKAVNGNVIAFQRKGIAIERADTTAGRLANTLRALSTQEGVATATTNTYAGATAKLNNEKTDLYKALGKLITQNPVFVESIKSKSETLATLAEWVNKNHKFINDLAIAVGITAVAIAAGAAASAIYTTAMTAIGIATLAGVTGFQALAIYASAAWAAMTAPVTLTVAAIAAVVAIVYELVKNWTDVKAVIYDATAATLEYAARAASVFSDNTANSLKAEAQAWRDKAKATREAAQADAENTQEAQQQANQRKQKLAQELADNQRINDAKAELARINAQELEDIEAEHNLKLEDIRSGYEGTNLEKRQAHERALLQLQIDAEVAKANLENDAKTRKENLEKIYYKGSIERAKLNAKQEEEVAKLRIQNQKDTFSTIATLSSSNNQTLASIGKAAGITQIAIDTPVAIAKAIAAFPPPFNFAAAAVVGAAMAAQAAQIAGVKFADGGIVPGTSITGDRITAGVNSGEMILNRQQQATLFAIANGKSNSGGISREDLASLVSEVSNRPIVVNVDGRELINVIRAQKQSGRSI